jgi:predicted nucleic acid-binding protein
MNADYFLDTNILIYSFDDTNPEKRNLARELVRDSLIHGRGVVSWQVVQEFINVALHRWEKTMSTADAERYISHTLQPLCKIYPDPLLWKSALQIQSSSGYQWYDSLIVASAIKSGCRFLYSEDLQDGRSFGDLLIRNPFA